MPPASSADGAGHVKALVVLIAAVAICALVVWFGAPVAELFLTDQSSPVFAESIFTVVIYGGLLAAAAAGAKLSGVNPFRLGRNPAASGGAGFAIGAVGVTLAAAYAWLAGTMNQLPGQGGAALLLSGTLLIILQAGSEEVYFRGWLQPVLAERWGTAAAIGLAAAAFALLHVIGGARSPITILNLLLGGLLFGLLAASRGGIAAAAAGHIAWNWTEQLILGLVPNPGLGAFGSLMDWELAGATLWGGSEEGLNASLAMTFALSLFVVPLLLWSIPGAASARDRSGPAPA